MARFNRPFLKEGRQIRALQRFKMKESRKGIQSLEERAEERERLEAIVKAIRSR
jgi:hypothetical protein